MMPTVASIPAVAKHRAAGRVAPAEYSGPEVRDTALCKWERHYFSSRRFALNRFSHDDLARMTDPARHSAQRAANPRGVLRAGGTKPHERD
jgi:hypothetical protein